jgi:eukaryotic-like serine/threonine-protein kinase
MIDEPGLGLAEEVELPPVRRLSIGDTGLGPSGAKQYLLLAAIARGGMGEVYLAQQADSAGNNRRHVIVKRLLESLQEDEDYVKMFQSEGEHLARLDHPNVVKIFDAPMIAGSRCLALEYVAGRSVAQILDRCRHTKARIPPEVCCFILSEVLAGLDHVHRAEGDDGRPLGLVHRDVTPGNLLVSFEGDVKLTDFGIAKSQMSAVSTTVGIVKGKARYLAPEQILGERATARSDLFACGCVLYEMLTGQPLFERPSVPRTLTAIVQGELPELAAVIPVKSPKLLEVLKKSLSTKREQRHEGAADMAIDLIAAARELGNVAEKKHLSTFMRSTFEGVREPWEEIADLPPPPAPPPPAARPGAPHSDPPTVLAESDKVTTLESAEPIPEPPRPELRFRAEPIAEEEAIREPPKAAQVATVMSSEDTPASEPPSMTSPAVQRLAIYEDTALVERNREPGPTIRIPEKRPPSDSPLENEETVSADEAPPATGSVHLRRIDELDPPSDVATISEIPLRAPPPAAEPQIVRKEADREESSQTPTLDHLPTKVDVKSAGAPDPFLAFIPERRSGPPTPSVEREIIGLKTTEAQRPTQRIKKKKKGLPIAVVFGAVFVLGTASGMGLYALVVDEAPRPPPAVAPETKIAEPPPAPEPAPPPAPAPAPVVVEPQAPDPDLDLDNIPPEDPIHDFEAEADIPAPGKAMIDIPYPKGAKVKLDGVLLKKKTPIKSLELDPGAHEVVILLPTKKKPRVIPIVLDAGDHLDLDQIAPDLRK